MTDRELLELIAAQVGVLTKEVSGLKVEVSGLKGEVLDLKGGQNTLAKEVSDLKEGQNTLAKEVSYLKEGQNKIENEVRKTNNTIDNEIKPKIMVLFDGHIQINDQLDRIEKEVSRHEEVIIRKIK